MRNIFILIQPRFFLFSLPLFPDLHKQRLQPFLRRFHAFIRVLDPDVLLCLAQPPVQDQSDRLHPGDRVDDPSALVPDVLQLVVLGFRPLPLRPALPGRPCCRCRP